ncbi:LLM class flavin-dependent oxidoreductase [Dactylosporangium darangshiense]|uniref:LLM class flavin-dependent oxidoreductase n=1 Tax=Dactylosporangium darangshiense TaxID=579108 RepID=UPI00362D46A1
MPGDARLARLGETLEIVGGLLGGAAVTTSGRFHRLRDASLLPPPDRRIPLLVAGAGPGVLRLAAPSRPGLEHRAEPARLNLRRRWLRAVPGRRCGGRPGGRVRPA